MRLRLSLAVSIAALLLLVPAGTANAKFCGGAATQSDGSSWRDVTVRGTSCVRGFTALDGWARRVEKRGLRKSARVFGWSCRYAAKRGANGRHGRVTCRRGAGRARFYGYDKPAR